MSQATTAIYLWIGFDAERRRQGAGYPDTPGGFVDIPDALETYAAVVESWYEEVGTYLEMPGCFDYEITEELGAWLFHHFDAHPYDFCREINRYVAAWMAEQNLETTK